MKITLRRIWVICMIKWTNEFYNFGQSETGCFWRKTNELFNWFSFGPPNRFGYVLLIIHSLTLVLEYGYLSSSFET